MYINAHAFVCIYVKVYVHVCVYAYDSTHIQDFLIPSDHSVDLAIGIGGSCELIEFAHNGHMVSLPNVIRKDSSYIQRHLYTYMCELIEFAHTAIW